MSEWITDRRPTENDADVHNNVYNRYGVYTHWVDIEFGEPWMHTNRPEPYVKPKRYWVEQRGPNSYGVMDVSGIAAGCIPTREAAERIAAIYEEVMP